MPRTWLFAPALAMASCDQVVAVNDVFMDQRNIMVDDQIAGRGVRDPRVLAAMRTVLRHEFVPKKLREYAYVDRPLSIGFGQTISQPYIVAFMTEQLRLEPEHRVLEIGTGSGYQAAILARLVSKVYSIEIVPDLATRASQDLRRLGFTNVSVKSGDGYQGWKEHAPFDAVIVTCAPDHVPPRLVEQVKEGGRIMIPVGDFGDQTLYLLEKRQGVMLKHSVLPVRFVPMTGEAQEKAP